MTTKSSTTKTKQTRSPRQTAGRGYANHLKGSRKEATHIAYDTKGPQAAEALGLAAGLKQSTLRSWFGHWARAAKATPTPKAQPVTKSKKAPTKKATTPETKEPAAKAA